MSNFNAENLINNIKNSSFDNTLTSANKYQLMQACLDYLANCPVNEWEEEFLFDMEIRVRKQQGYTEKQLTKLHEIYLRYKDA